MDVNGMINVNSTNKVLARKPHRKTRTGCRTCKQRKIKCDEQRPSCNNCIKHSVPCDFMSSDSGTNSTNNLSLPSHSPPNNSPYVGSSLLNFNSNPNPNYDPALTEQSSLNLTDLHLLHNYTTGTADTLHTDSALKTLFRINVPQTAFDYDFVMHAILALSAQHLGHYSPTKRTYYASLASRHHQLGLRLATSPLQNINAGNCDAVYIFSALTLFYTFATPRKPGDFLLVGEKGIAEWLLLVRGTSSIMSAFEERLRVGPFGPLFIAGSRRSQLREQYLKDVSVDRDPLYTLEGLIQNNCLNRDHIPILMEDLNLLRKSFIYMHVPGGIPGFEIGDIFSWVFRVSEEFLELLRQNSQEALCIFAYFCVVLRRLDGHWWMEGWSVFLMERIWGLLDSEHRLWARWPIEEIGWIPT